MKQKLNRNCLWIIKNSLWNLNSIFTLNIMNLFVTS
ncbi:unnamed protein product [Paramecium octaurelia]|uniref:Uncharacterized protein n=1 Tax=Paramecium octaurelia TaxID=43137 RepID=A0A8S1VQW0_PAROT|nr:unnamed protein product [Paramecium octaurelia]